DDGGRLTLQHHDRLFDVVGVQRDLGAGREDRDAGGDLVALGVPFADQWERLDARAPVERLDVVRVQNVRVADWLVVAVLVVHLRLRRAAAASGYRRVDGACRESGSTRARQTAWDIGISEM